MADQGMVDRLLKSVEDWNTWRQGQGRGHTSPDFSEANFKGAELTGADLRGANFQGANLEKAILAEAHLKDAQFKGANLKGAILDRADLENAGFTDADLKNASLGGSNLVGAQFGKAHLEEASLLGSTMDLGTKFHGAHLEKCAIDRYGLECLHDGGITIGMRMDMNIRDDVAILRQSYSGFWQWFQVAALLGFLFPYLWFVAVQWGKARFNFAVDDPSMPLWQALLRFIYNGGVEWQTSFVLHWSFVLFMVALIYNAMRFGLLVKTKSLEMAQDSSGLPARFSLEASLWGRFHRFSKFVGWIYLVSVVANLLHFFTMEIPTNAG